jgi:uracil-DNA glycosylase
LLEILQQEIVECMRCPRLREHCINMATIKRRAYREWEYWGKPVPGFGGPKARVLVLGLAPAAHGANRTGRIFTGDRSGDWLYRALHRAGFANQPESTHANDGLVLRDAYVTCVVRCAPPGNKPSPNERDRCVPFLARELELLQRARVIVALGAFAWDGVLRAARSLGHAVKPRPAFSHGAVAHVGPYTVIGSYHVSQQNTFTGRLTEAMLDAVLASAKLAADHQA